MPSVIDQIPSSGGIDRHAAQRGQDLDAVVLAVAVGVFPQRHIPHPVPAVFDRPARADGSEQGLGTSSQTRDVVTGLLRRPALADSIAAQGNDRRSSRALLHHPLWCWHGPQVPGEPKDPEINALIRAGSVSGVHVRGTGTENAL